MGLYANYMYLSDDDLNHLKNFDKNDILDKAEDLDETVDLAVNIDKMWDVMHFVFTGISSSEPIEDDPLSEAIVGVSSFDEVEEFVAYTPKGRVSEIVLALEAFDIDEAMDNFSMKKCKKAKLYPNIWDYEDEEEDIKEEICNYFDMMKDFYKKILEKNANVLVTIY